jgi:hypothetical protein
VAVTVRRVSVEAELILEQKGAAARIIDVVSADRILQDGEHNAVAGRRRPEMVALGRIEPVRSLALAFHHRDDLNLKEKPRIGQCGHPDQRAG